VIRNFHLVASDAQCVTKCLITQPVAQPISPRFTIETLVARTSSELLRAAAQQRHAGMQAGAGIAAAVGVGASAGAAMSRVCVGAIARAGYGNSGPPMGNNTGTGAGRQGVNSRHATGQGGGVGAAETTRTRWSPGSFLSGGGKWATGVLQSAECRQTPDGDGIDGLAVPTRADGMLNSCCAASASAEAGRPWMQPQTQPQTQGQTQGVKDPRDSSARGEGGGGGRRDDAREGGAVCKKRDRNAEADLEVHHSSAALDAMSVPPPCQTGLGQRACERVRERASSAYCLPRTLCASMRLGTKAREPAYVAHRSVRRAFSRTQSALQDLRGCVVRACLRACVRAAVACRRIGGSAVLYGAVNMNIAISNLPSTLGSPSIGLHIIDISRQHPSSGGGGRCCCRGGRGRGREWRRGG
jgi:hypothetical protein